MDISVLIPVRNEANALGFLIPRLLTTLGSMNLKWEVIFVTDINSDNTYEVLKVYHEKHPQIKIIKLTNSFGQHIAIWAGLRLCKGKCAVIMDGDLEVFPEDIPKLYRKQQEGYDIVYGHSKTKNRSLFRDTASRLFRRVMSTLTDYTMESNSNMFRIISRRVINEILRFEEYDPSLTYIMGLINLPSAGIPLSFGKREHGRTKYSLKKQLNFALNSLLSFSTTPLRMISALGFFISLASFIYLAVVAIQKLFVEYSGFGWGTVIVLIIFFGGLQLFAIGIIGEYIGRIFIQSKNRPRYIIEEKTGDL